MIIGFCGKAGSGKNLAAEIVSVKRHYKEIAFADPLKRFCMEVYGFSKEHLWGASYLRDQPVEIRPGVFLTPRKALQTLGTEWGRALDEKTWVTLGIRAARRLLNENIHYDAAKGFQNYPWSVPRYEGVCITDVRFMTEIEAFHEEPDMKVVKIVRPWVQTALNLEAQQHKSETEQDEISNEAFHYILHNNGTVEEFTRKIEEMMSFFGR